MFKAGFSWLSLASFEVSMQLHAPSTPHNSDNDKFAKQSNL